MNKRYLIYFLFLYIILGNILFSNQEANKKFLSKAISGKIILSPGSSIQNIIDQNREITQIELENGDYEGPLIINRRLTLKGKSNSIIHSKGKGTTIRITAPGVELNSITIDGSGIRYDVKDAAIYVESDQVTITKNIITNAVFGIIVEQSSNVIVEDNIIFGNPESTLGLRGDGIRIWETTHSVIRNNRVINSRDLVVWYSYHNKIEGNLIKNGRYGTHFMYSHFNRFQNNQLINNIVGTFIMYSRNLEFFDNFFFGTSGPSGYGLGVKESGNLKISNNLFIKNTIGIYLDTSPYDDREDNQIINNTIALSHIGINFHGSSGINSISNNNFKNNRFQIQITGNYKPKQIDWKNNYFDDYEGYDLDNDKIGDIPYIYRTLVGDLSEKTPNLSFFDGTIAHYFINLIGKILPLFQPKILLKDESPLMKGNL